MVNLHIAFSQIQTMLNNNANNIKFKATYFEPFRWSLHGFMGRPLAVSILDLQMTNKMLNTYAVKKTPINKTTNWFLLHVNVKEVTKNNAHLCTKKREIRCFFLAHVKT